MNRSVGRTLLVILIAFHATASSSNAQNDADEFDNLSTPEVHFPEFYLAAVGDFPEGYFRDVEITPGSTQQLTIAVVNSGEITADIRVFKTNALTKQNGGFTPAVLEDDPIGSTAWIDFPELDLSLEPGDQELLVFNVTVPEGTGPGQYMSSFVAQTASTVAIPGTEDLDQIIGYSITISIIVPGDFDVSFVLQGVEVVEVEGYRFVLVDIENTGGYLVRPEGEWVLSDKKGAVVHQAPVSFGSVYSGLSTQLLFYIPDQLPGGDYMLGIELHDPESGAESIIDAESVIIPALGEFSGITMQDAIIEPNAEEIVFANVDITLNNGGPQIPATDVNLEVLRDGKVVDVFPLASNQVMVEGENTYSTRYIPVDMWESGTYTFRITVSAISPDGEERTELLNEDLFSEIVVP